MLKKVLEKMRLSKNFRELIININIEIKIEIIIDFRKIDNFKVIKEIT